MNVLKALGMIAVVGGHCGVNFLPWFPVYSFHMPLFIFISGYFFHDKKFSEFLKSKIKHLVIPLLSWNLIFGLLCTLLLSCGIISFGHKLSLYSLFVEPFLHGHQFVFNLATWFVGTLVELQILYWCLNRLCKGNQILLTIISFAFYLIAWIMGDNSIQKQYGVSFLALEKVLFLMIFYQLGYLYKKYIEKKDVFSVNRIVLLVILNGFLMGFVNRDITFGVSWMRVSYPILLPLIVAMSGIYLYIQAAELLKDKVKRNSLLGIIGENTFSIMTLHLFFFWLLNTLFLALKYYQIFPLRSFDYNRYMHDIFFRVTEHAPMVDGMYFLVGMAGSLACVYVYDQCKPFIFSKIRALNRK